MDIIKALTSTYSLEGEFEVQKSIQFIENLKDIELLKPYAIKLLRTNAKQAHFVSTSLDVLASQQAYIYKLEKQLDKKKATFWDRFKYIIFRKK
tara:strand:- start:80 stop:361 length:282 start_codon:yes stop_codon:yes gene_type:complete